LKLALPDVTLIIVDGVEYARAKAALLHCTSLCNFAEAKVLTHLPGEDHFRHQIQPIESIYDYSEFVIKELANYFATSHVLMAQWDGFVWQTAMWSDEFLQYDYIGASWPQEIAQRAVGNGGFSLRSKKLYRALLDLRRRYSLEDMTQRLTQNDICEDKFVGHSIPEDNLICKIYRPTLEQQYGIRFAPADLADRFSIETNAGSPWFGTSFGFHGHFAGSFYIKAD